LDSRDEWSAQSYVIRAQDMEQRNKAMEFLNANGVESKRGVMAVHREAPYSEIRDESMLPNTVDFTDRTFRLPIYDMSDIELSYVCDIVKGIKNVLA
jgi:dTDP-4-amino-4,6-dideoxygalactose transaminase